MQERMYSLVEKHINSNRSPVSEANNMLVSEVMETLGGSIIKADSGTDVLTWKIPKRWEVREAYIAKKTGEKLVDFKDSPLHLWTHSVPFSGTISKAELSKHIKFNEDNPDWIEFHSRNGYRYDALEWGFSLTFNQWKQFEEEEYFVCIDADLDNNGTMFTGDCLVEGDNKETVFFAAHSCHPAIATDGLTCVAVLTELFKVLRSRKTKYSYRCIIGPEYFAAASFLALTPHEELKNLKAGVYLDMLGNRKKFGLQSSFEANALIDRIALNVFCSSLSDFEVHKYRKLWGNDEMFYNGPSYHIPTIGFAGCKHEEYHFNTDNLELVDFRQLEQAVEMLLKIIEVIETDYVPALQYKGPLYLSKYNLYIDPKINPDGYKNIEAMQILANGKNSCFDIADELGIDFFLG